MIYRVDYVLGVMFLGLVVGFIFSRWTSAAEPSRLARGYFVVVAILLALRAVVFAITVVLPAAHFWTTTGNAMGDVTNFFFGFLFGIALLRRERREILCDPSIYFILCISAGIGFIMAGYVKAFSMQGMTQFFAQSGYSPSFLKFIMTAEVLGGAALLIPFTVLPAIAGLAIDMFGAIYTHIHNGDPLNDSTGAIAALIRFAVIVFLWAWRPRPADVAGSVRRRLSGAAAVAACCAIVAVGGSAMVRHHTAASKSSAANHVNPAASARVVSANAKPARHTKQTAFGA